MNRGPTKGHKRGPCKLENVGQQKQRNIFWYVGPLYGVLSSLSFTTYLYVKKHLTVLTWFLRFRNVLTCTVRGSQSSGNTALKLIRRGCIFWQFYNCKDAIRDLSLNNEVRDSMRWNSRWISYRNSTSCNRFIPVVGRWRIDWASLVINTTSPVANIQHH